MPPNHTSLDCERNFDLVLPKNVLDTCIYLPREQGASFINTNRESATRTSLKLFKQADESVKISVSVHPILLTEAPQPEYLFIQNVGKREEEAEMETDEYVQLYFLSEDQEDPAPEPSQVLADQPASLSDKSTADTATCHIPSTDHYESGLKEMVATVLLKELPASSDGVSVIHLEHLAVGRSEDEQRTVELDAAVADPVHGMQPLGQETAVSGGGMDVAGAGRLLEKSSERSLLRKDSRLQPGNMDKRAAVSAGRLSAKPLALKDHKLPSESQVDLSWISGSRTIRSQGATTNVVNKAEEVQSVLINQALYQPSAKAKQRGMPPDEWEITSAAAGALSDGVLPPGDRCGGGPLRNKSRKRPCYKREQNVNCPFCPAKLKNMDSVLSHVSAKHSEEESFADVLRKIKEDKRAQCTQCGSVLSSQLLLKEHTQRLHQSHPVQHCPYCAVKLKSSLHLKGHLRRMHGTQRTDYLCHLCPASFRLQAYLQAHIKTVHPGNPNATFSCEQCSFTCTNEKYLKNHRARVHGPRKFTCDRCRKAFTSSPGLQRHTLLVHKSESVQQYSCPDCDRKFSLKANMKDHYQTVHCKNYRYECHVCEAGFRSKKFLSLHVSQKHVEMAHGSDATGHTGSGMACTGSGTTMTNGGTIVVTLAASQQPTRQEGTSDGGAINAVTVSSAHDRGGLSVH